MVATRRSELDIAAGNGLVDVVQRIGPTVIVNCAAYNDVDHAEDAPVSAFEVNALGVRALARPPPRLERPSFTTAPISSSREPHRLPTRRRILPTLRASMPARSWWVSGSRRWRRSIMCCVSKACSGAPSAAAVWTRSSTPFSRGEKRASSSIAPSHPAMRPMLRADEAECSSGTRRLVYTTASIAGTTTWYDLAQAAAAQLGRQPRLASISVHDVQLRARRPQDRALCNAQLVGGDCDAHLAGCAGAISRGEKPIEGLRATDFPATRRRACRPKPTITERVWRPRSCPRPTPSRAHSRYIARSTTTGYIVRRFDQHPERPPRQFGRCAIHEQVVPARGTRTA